MNSTIKTQTQSIDFVTKLIDRLPGTHRTGGTKANDYESSQTDQLWHRVTSQLEPNSEEMQRIVIAAIENNSKFVAAAGRGKTGNEKVEEAFKAIPEERIDKLIKEKPTTTLLALVGMRYGDKNAKTIALTERIQKILHRAEDQN